MITGIEEANVYFLKPIDVMDTDYDPTQDYTPEQLEAYPDLVADNALVVGSKHVMNQVAVYMSDDDVIATTGVAGERCVIITTLPRETCKKIIEKGTRVFNKRAAEIMKGTELSAAA